MNRLTDFEIEHLCGQAMFSALEWEQRLFDYDPLHDDAQAMALLKRFGLFLGRFSDGMWCVDSPLQEEQMCSYRNCDLNRAICECVAHTQNKS